MDETFYNEANMISFLASPDAYQHQPSEVKIIQTHASILAIAPPYVFKVKKHVDLGFLNFKSIEERKANAEREIALNRRLCASIYLGIVPIFFDNGTYSFSSGEIVADYALKMRQLKDGYFLNQLLLNDQVDALLLDKVLNKLATFYESHDTHDNIKKYGSIDYLKRNTDENFQYLKEASLKNIQPELVAMVKVWVDQFYAERAELFDKRIRENKIKDCHGDLHLDHIHIYHDAICIYDCIEFNDRFRYIDIASDIAFLAMDFDFYNYPAFSQYISNRIATLMNDPEMPELMDFYKSYRACVRAKVEAIKSRQREVTEEAREKSLKDAEKYFRLALRYAAIGSQPCVFLVGGRVGSGKSTLARAIAEALGIEYVSSDVIRKTKAGVPLFETTAPELKAQVYSAEKTGEVYQEALNQVLKFVNEHKSVVADATFGSRKTRKLFIDSLESKNIKYIFIEAFASEEVTRQRLAQRDTEENVISDARLQDFEKLNAAYEPIDEIAKEKYLQIDTEVEVFEEIKQVFGELGNG